MRFRQSALLYGLASGLSRGIGFLMLPIYVREVSASDFGIFDFWTAQILFLAPIIYIQIWDGLYQLATQEPHRRDVVVRTSVLVALVGSLFYLLAAAPILFTQAGSAWAYFLTFGMTLALQNFMTFTARMNGQVKLLAVSGIINATVVAVSTVSILAISPGPKALVAGLCLGNIVQAATLTAPLVRSGVRWGPHWDAEIFRRLARFCLPLCITSLSYWALTGLTRIVILTLEGSTVTGEFAVASRVGAVITAIGAVLSLAWSDAVYRSKWTPLQTKERLSMLVGTILTITAIGILLLNATFSALFPATYAGARSLIPVMMVFSGIMAANGFASVIFMARGHTGTLALTGGLAAMINLVAAPVFVGLWGAVGGCLTLAAISGAMFAHRYLQAQTILRLKNSMSCLTCPALMMAMSIVIFQYQPHILWTLLAITLALALLLRNIVGQPWRRTNP